MRLPIQASSIHRGPSRRKPPVRVDLSSAGFGCVVRCVETDFTLNGLTACQNIKNASAFISCMQRIWAEQESLADSVMFRGIAQCALQCL